MKCPVCNTEGKPAFNKKGFQVKKCMECEHLFVLYQPDVKEVTEIYSDGYFYKGGDGYPDYTKERELLISRGEYYAEIAEKWAGPGKVLDVGSAAGFILKGFSNKGWTGIGIDPNSTMTEFGRKEYNLDLHTGTIETFKCDHKFDLVTMIQVIAHLYDLQTSIRNVSSLLETGGLVLIETWNNNSITARLTGKHWHEISPPSTLNYFSKKSLNILMSGHGFTLVGSGRPVKKIKSGHAKSLLFDKVLNNTKFKFFAGAIKLIPENITLRYPAEDLFWSMFRKQ